MVESELLCCFIRAMIIHRSPVVASATVGAMAAELGVRVVKVMEAVVDASVGVVVTVRVVAIAALSRLLEVGEVVSDILDIVIRGEVAVRGARRVTVLASVVGEDVVITMAIRVLAIAVMVVRVLSVARDGVVVTVSLVALGHVAHEDVTLVGLIGGPASGTVRLHGVATTMARGEELVEIDEGILLVERVRHGRARMGEGDVVTTVIITTVHSVVHVGWEAVALLLILRLVDGAESVRVVIEGEWVELRPLSEHGLGAILACAVSTDAEEFLDTVGDDWPLGGANWSVVTAVELILEDLVIIASLSLSESLVNKEDWGKELLATVVNWLPHVALVLVKRTHVWLLGNDWVLDGSLGLADHKWDALLTLNMLSLLEGSLLSLAAWGGKFGEITLDVRVVVGGLT